MPMCRDSIALGAGLCSLFLLRKLDRLNLVDRPRDEDLSLPATGGGAKWGFAVAMGVAPDGMAIETGRLWKLRAARADEGVLMCGTGGGGGWPWGKACPGDELSACDMFWLWAWAGVYGGGGEGMASSCPDRSCWRTGWIDMCAGGAYCTPGLPLPLHCCGL